MPIREVKNAGVFEEVPIIERTRMFSVRPGTRGRRQQKPRIIKSIGTPASDARHKASIMSGSSSWFILATIRAGRPARWFSIPCCISSSKRGRMVVGATRSAEQCGATACPVR